MDSYFTVSTRTEAYTTTRRIVCRDLDTTYTVAIQLRKRLSSHGYRTLPMPGTTIYLTEFEGSPPSDSGRVMACSTWLGAPTMAEAIELAAHAEWLAVPRAHPASGCCLPMPERRKVRV